MDLRHRAFDLAFRAIALARADRWAAPAARGRGVILTLHRVRQPKNDPFQPNRILEITPDFLDFAIGTMRRMGVDLVTMDEALQRLRGGAESFFAALTFDDGFRDTLEMALPVLRRHAAPATVYCVPGFADGQAPLWWVDLEEAIRGLSRVELEIEGEALALTATTPQEKQAAFESIYWKLRRLPEPDLRRIVAGLAARAGHDSEACVRRLCLDWEGLAQLAADPLITIGAHSMTHPRLGTLPADAARQEMQESRAVLENRLQTPVHHFAYPVGDAVSAGRRDYAMASEIGFASAVTTRPGHLHIRHRESLTALPRVSLNGLHQNARALRALLSGLPFLGMRN
jgi:peptidoglycan/xylan/chitin deacetylase (PgdA/CDA1 family)